ncbi:CBU_0592 family membrane protein [Winogradskyella ouciana]|uniref:CBU_0592 family membrane protein n=1 Tax=Winogradskyella ouciana TaxID=2608631 RepID=UPI003D2A8538
MRLLIDILGWSGSGLIILAYALTLIENKKYLDHSKYLNLLGGLLIAINCYYYNAIPPFVTNLLWSVIATLTIYKSRNKKEKCNKTKCLT